MSPGSTRVTSSVQREPSIACSSALGIVADIERKGQPPRRWHALHVVDAALPEHGLDVDDGHAQRPHLIVENVDRRHDLPRPRRRAGAVRRVGEVALVHVDRDDRGMRAVGERLESGRQVALLAVDVSLHRIPPASAVLRPGADCLEHAEIGRARPAGRDHLDAAVGLHRMLDADRHMDRLARMERQNRRRCRNPRPSRGRRG